MYYIMRTTHEKNIVMNQLRQNNFPNEMENWPI